MTRTLEERLEERAAKYIARIQPGFEGMRSYSTDCFEAKYSALIETARSKGIINERRADILRRALAGETYKDIARGGGSKGQDVSITDIWAAHKWALQRLRNHVFSNMVRTLEERADKYVARIQPDFEKAHPYFAEGFKAKYSALIETALSKGIIKERYAAILRKALAGEIYETISKGGGKKGQDVSRAQISDSHGRALQRLRHYVFSNTDGFDKLFWKEAERVVNGNGDRPPTAYETLFYNAYLAQGSSYSAQRMLAEQTKGIVAQREARVAELESQLAEPMGKRNGFVSPPGTPHKIDPKFYYGMRIQDADWPTYLSNTLRRGHITLIGEITEMSEAQLLDIKGLGRKGIELIKASLGSFGLSLRYTEPHQE